MLTALAFCVLTQATKAEVADLEFTRIQIEWIAATGVVRDFEQVLPRRQAMLLRSLGCEHHNCRTLARDELEDMEHDASMALCWGMRAKDPAIAMACRTLYGRLCRCNECNGSGQVYIKYSDYWTRCVVCGGLGDHRLVKRLIEGGEVVMPAELFRRRVD